MATIPALAYMIVGFLVSAFSRIVVATTGKDSIMLFFYVGIVFFLVGVIKALLWHANKKKNMKRPIDQQPNKVQYHVHSAAQKPTVVLCPHCKKRVYSTARFCAHCGAKLR